MFRRLLALPVAFVGLLASHELAYRLVAQEPANREMILATTGHGWLKLIPFLLATGVLALGWTAWRTANGTGRTPKLLEVLATQTVAYATVEIVERLLVGHSPWPGLDLFLAGALVQLPVALVVWAALRYLLVPAAEAVLKLLRTRRPLERATSVKFHVTTDVFHTRPAVTTAGRGPPSRC